MPSKKLLALLQSLSHKDHKSFNSFLSSPYFNRNQRLIRLHQYLIQSKKSKSPPSKEQVYQLLYPDSDSYNDQQVYDQLSLLYKLLKKFLQQQYYESQPPQQQLDLLRALSSNQREDHFLPVYRATQKSLDQTVTIDNFFHKLQLQSIADEFAGYNPHILKQGQLEALMASLDTYYLAAKLRYSCEMHNRHLIANRSYQNPLLSQLISYLQSPENPYLHIPIISIYYHILLTFTHSQEPEIYPRLVKLLDEHTQLFSQAEAGNMYTYALNYCIRQLNKGQTHYLHELFTLIKTLLQKDILLDQEGYLSHAYFKNMVTTGLRLKEYDWVKELIKTYQDRIHPAYRQHAHDYNMALYHYELGEYTQALRLLQQVDVRDTYYHLSAKAMLLKIYFELEEDTAFESLTTTFRIYLNRNKKSLNYQHELYMNLLRFAHKAYRLRTRKATTTPGKFSADVIKLLQQVEQTKKITNIAWLISQIKALSTV